MAGEPDPEKGRADFQFLAENSADVICRVGLDMRFRYVSPSAFNVLGWKPEEMVGTGPEALVLAEDLPRLAAAAERNLRPGERSLPVTVRLRKRDGSVAWMETAATVVRDPITGEPSETVIVMRDVSERHALEEKLRALSLTDGLTGLANRRAFDENLKREWLRTLRDGSPISLLLLDLDRFKEFNDHYGHQVGDDCLRAVALAIRGSVRATDLSARYGGEEMTVILPSTDTAGAVAAAEKVRSAIEALRIPHQANAQGGGWVTASIGAATALPRYGGTMTMPESLLLAADNALYKAKRDGRNCVATALLMASKDGIDLPPGHFQPS
jgi:diguanylate cyclase (GGDEF)-like protein/PAS domain S-box-containing protein